MVVLVYISAILAGNWLSSTFAPINLFGFLVSPGTFTIGTTFFLRDFIQEKHGRKKTYYFIVSALGLSAIQSFLCGQGLSIVLASSVAFAISESTDTEIYTRLKLPKHLKVFLSGFAGGVLDSTVFIVLGLSPIGMGFLPWAAIPAAVVSQSVIKILMQTIAAICIKLKRS